MKVTIEITEYSADFREKLAIETKEPEILS